MLKVKKNSPKSILKISYLGHQTYKKVINNFSENINLNNITLDEENDQLDEVIVKADILL